MRTITAVRRENGPVENALLQERKIIEALTAREPVSDEFYPAEQARVLQLLIERINLAPDVSSVTLQSAGIRSVVPDVTCEKAEAASETTRAPVSPPADPHAAPGFSNTSASFATVARWSEPTLSAKGAATLVPRRTAAALEPDDRKLLWSKPSSSPAATGRPNR